MKRIVLVHIGAGTVGGAAISQVLANREYWQAAFGIDVTIGAVIGSGGAIVADTPAGLPAQLLHEISTGRQSGIRVTVSAERAGFAPVDPLVAVGKLAPFGHLIALDAGAGAGTATIDAAVLDLGGSVVLSNKAPLALPAGTAGDRLWAEAGPLGRVRYEATCGAGLPVISTLRTLIDTGDTIEAISGTVSGTFGAIFSDVAAGQPFSTAVRVARANGYTEPDPRDDLSGLDVARKALILARTIGRRVELDDIAIESLVPAQLADVTVDEFLDQISVLDADITERARAAAAENAVLKYVATVTPEGALSVGIAPVATSTVLGALQGPENIVTIRTGRYQVYPLNVTGPGAGAAVTAAGMTGDMLVLSQRA